MSEERKSERVSGNKCILMFVLLFCFIQCKKSSNSSPTPPPPPPNSTAFNVVTQTVNSISFNSAQTLRGINNNPVIQVSFSDKVDRSSVLSAISYNNKSQGASNVPFGLAYSNNDSTIIITPSNNIGYLNEFIFSISTLLKSVSGKALSGRVDLD